MIRSVQLILCVEKILQKHHPKPFRRHKQITIIKSLIGEVPCCRSNSTHRPSPELCSVLNKLDINLHGGNWEYFEYLYQKPRKHVSNTPNIKVGFTLKIHLVGKREITVFAQNDAYPRFGATLEWDPFWAPRQGDLAQISGFEQAYEFVHHSIDQVITLF